MCENKFNQRFELPNGEILQIHDSYKGQFYAHAIQAIYLDEPDRNVMMSDEWKACNCKKVEKESLYVNPKENTRGSAKVTYVTARNLDWVEYPLVKSYDSDFCINCEYKIKIEVVLMAEEYKRRLFVEWNGRFSMADYLRNLEDNLIEEFVENYDRHGIKIYEDDYECFGVVFYTDLGEYTELEIEKKDLVSMVASVRVVEFESNIVS